MSRKIPSLNGLRVFEAAARLESFARAAEQLDMSTSAVSQQVKALEKHLGEPLFKRGARQVELTDAGYAFLPSVRQALNTVEESTRSLFGDHKDYTLKLQADLIFTTSWLAPRLPDFNDRNPKVQLHLTGAFRDSDYRHAGAEIKILFGPVHRSWAQCDRLFSETIYPVAVPSIATTIRCPEDFLHHRLIQISTHRINWNQIMQALSVDSIPTRQLCFTENTQLSMALAASGYGIALARSPTTDDLVVRYGLQKIPLCPDVASSESYYVVYQNYENLSLAARTFHQWLLESVEQG